MGTDDRCRGPEAPDDRPQERFRPLDGDVSAWKRNLANADQAGEQERHIEMDKRGGPMDPGDRPDAWSRLRAGHRLDVLLQEVENRLRCRERKPDGREARSRARPPISPIGDCIVRPPPDPAYARRGAVEPLVEIGRASCRERV